MIGHLSGAFSTAAQRASNRIGRSTSRPHVPGGPGRLRAAQLFFFLAQLEHAMILTLPGDDYRRLLESRAGCALGSLMSSPAVSHEQMIRKLQNAHGTTIGAALERRFGSGSDVEFKRSTVCGAARAGDQARRPHGGRGRRNHHWQRRTRAREKNTDEQNRPP